MPGVVRTRVGYTGGSGNDPTYHRLGDHTEALQVDFNPEHLSYRELIKSVLERHDPFNNVGHTQYRNGLWFHNPDQRETIRSVLGEHYDAGPESSKIETVIEPLDTFHRAEDYHQKYYLRKHNEYMQLFEDLTGDAFTDSTPAARLNGILAGKTTRFETFESLRNLNLPDHLKLDLQARAS